MTVLDIRTARQLTNGGTAVRQDIRNWPSVMITVDQDITFIWYEFLGSSYRVSTYGTDGPWDEIANPRNPEFASREWR